MRDFRRPFDATRDDSNCELKQNHTAPAKSCTCCMGALTFDEAKHVQDQVTGVRPGQPQMDRYFQNVPWTAGQVVENWRELFGLRSDKESLNSIFCVDSGNDKANLVFGDNGIMTRTLEHWKEMIKQASMLIDSLQKELLKARTDVVKLRRKPRDAL